MNELNIFITGGMLGCVVGVLFGSTLAFSVVRLGRTLVALSIIFGSCTLTIVATWLVCFATRGSGFIGYVSGLLLAPLAYIGIFAGWNLYSYALGAVVQTGLMTLAGWLTWLWIRRRKSKAGCEPAR